MLVTVFTPTYNRAHLLPRLFESLQRQTFRDFEWLVVDDGSTDETENLPFFKEEHEDFPIRYIRQENGGKHRAINRGVKEAEGELLFIADSDDWLPDDAFSVVADYYDEIKGNQNFAGVCGLDGTEDGRIIGSGLTEPVVDGSSLYIRNHLGVTGDMKEVFRTEVLRAFPFPEIQGERFCPEVLLWNRIASSYKLRYFNKIIYLVEYQADGITSGIVRARMQSPIASMMTYAEMTCYKDVPLAQKVKAAINYWRFRFCKKGNRDIPRMAWYWNVLMPLGWLMHKRDKAHMLN
jgi:glycosyltransferase involved in cell wall biosynthesis